VEGDWKEVERSLLLCLALALGLGRALALHLGCCPDDSNSLDARL
jgi:hypothetical protein